MAESVVEVELAVPAQESGVTDRDDGVVHPGLAGNPLEHAGHDCHLGRGGRLGESGHERSLKCLGHGGELVQGTVEWVHGGLGKHDQLGTTVGGGPDQAKGALAVGGEIDTRGELGDGDSHAQSLPLLRREV